jgi:hypothetical protein
MRVDPSAILRAGQAQASMGNAIAGLGRDIGGMIKQYGLNKEKRRKEEDTAMGTLAGMSPQELLQIGQENPKLGKAIERATSDQATPRDFQLINASAAPIMAGQLRRVRMEGLQNANKMAELNFGIAKELKDTRINITKNQGVMSDLATKLAQETDPKKRELLGVELQNQIDSITRLGQPRIEAEEAKFKAEKELLPKKTKALGTQLDTNIMQNEARQKIIPGETALQIKKQEVGSKQLDVENEVFDIIGIPGLAQIKADDLKTLSETKKAKLEGAKSYASYIRNKGYADLISAANKSSPTFKEQFKPIVELQGTILSKTVEVPGENKIVKFSEYLDLHQEDSDKYPMTGLAGELNAQFKSLDLSAQNLLRDQQVQVNLPDEPQVSATTSKPTMGQSFDYGNLDPSAADLMAGPGAVTPQITDPAAINLLRQGGTFRGKNLDQLIAEGAIRGQ